MIEIQVTTILCDASPNVDELSDLRNNILTISITQRTEICDKFQFVTLYLITCLRNASRQIVTKFVKKFSHLLHTGGQNKLFTTYYIFIARIEYEKYA